MLWTILIALITAGFITSMPLKDFGKIMMWLFGIVLGLCIFIVIVTTINARIEDANNKKRQEAYWEKVKQTPLIQWACNSDGHQLYLAERPEYVYYCSTGKLIAHSTSRLGKEPYWCDSPYKQVNHWKFCKPATVIKNSNYNHLLGN